MPLIARCASEIWRWGDQPGIISVPPCLVALLELAEQRGKRGLSCANGVGLFGTKAQRQCEHTALGDVRLRRLHQVAISSLRINSGEGVRGIELLQAITRCTGKAVTHLDERR